MILRELPFRAGDILPEEQLIYQLNVSIQHLNNTSLFNYVYVDYMLDTVERDDCLQCIVTVQVEERWYLWPQVSLKLEDRNLSSWLHEKDFNRITIGWGARIYNVFGLGHKVTASHYFGHEKGFRIGYYNIALNRERTSLLAFSVSNLYNKTLNIISEVRESCRVSPFSLEVTRKSNGEIPQTIHGPRGLNVLKDFASIHCPSLFCMSLAETSLAQV